MPPHIGIVRIGLNRFQRFFIYRRDPIQRRCQKQQQQTIDSPRHHAAVETREMFISAPLFPPQIEEGDEIDFMNQFG